MNNGSSMTRSKILRITTKRLMVVLAAISLGLVACNQQTNQDTGSYSDDRLTLPLPQAFSAIVVDETTFKVDVEVDSGNIVPCTNLILNTSAGTYSCIVVLTVGMHSLVLINSVIDTTFGKVRLTELSGIVVDVALDVSTAADLTTATLTNSDTDRDGISNIFELNANTDPAGDGMKTLRSGFKIDLGGVDLLPDKYLAASGQFGSWNKTTNSGSLKLVDTFGADTGAQLTVIGQFDYFNQSSNLSDVLFLSGSFVGDQIEVILLDITVSGLDSGAYDIYYYYHGSTSGMTINGLPLPDLIGKSQLNAGLVKDLNWKVITINIINGEDVVIRSDGRGNDGISGLQIVPR